MVAAILAINLYAAFSDAYNFPNAWFTRDDAYYYFKVAQNISEGRGSTFDGINPTNGYHPLWMAVCIPIFFLARFDLVLPLRVLVVLMSLLNAATAVLLFRMARSALSPPAAILTAAYWAFSPRVQSLVYVLGLETGLAAFFVILLLYTLYRFEKTWRAGDVRIAQIAWIALAALLAIFSRLDLVFLALVAGAWIIFRGSPLRHLLILDIPLLFTAMVAAVGLRSGLAEFYAYAPAGVVAGLCSLAIKIPLLHAAGLYQHPKHLAFPRLLRQSILSQTIGSLLLLGSISILVKAGAIPGFPRTALAWDWGLSILLIVLIRLGARALSRNQSPLQITPRDEFRQAWKSWLREGLTFYGIICAGLALYMIWNRAQFGTFTPVSGQIKYWWGALAETTYEGPPKTWLGFFAADPGGSFNAWPLPTYLLQAVRSFFYNRYHDFARVPEYSPLLLLLLAGLGAVSYSRRRRFVRACAQLGLPLLAAGSALQSYSYTALPYAGVQEWYWITQLVLTILAGGWIAHVIFHWLAKFDRGRAISLILSLGLAAFMSLRLASLVVSSMPYGLTAAGVPLLGGVAFLEENTPPGATIGMTGGGNTAYFIRDRTVVNMDGLINSHDYFMAMRAGHAADYLQDQGMQYIFASPGLLKLVPYQGQFDGRLRRVATLGGKVLLILLPRPSGGP